MLLVDDSRVARMMTAAAIGRLRPGWTVREVSTGEEALGVGFLARPLRDDALAAFPDMGSEAP